MVNLPFNAQQYTPNYGSDHKQLAPCKKVKVMIADEVIAPTKNGQGQMLVLTLRVVEGPMQGQEQTDRLLLWHPNPQTVAIANGQLSAYMWVMSTPQIQDTQQLRNKPFLVDIDWQKGQEPTTEKPEGGYTEVKALYDIAGNKAGAATGGGQQQTQQQPPNPPPAGVGASNPAPQANNSFRQPDPAPQQPAWQGNAGQPNNGGAPGNNWNNR